MCFLANAVTGQILFSFKHNMVYSAEKITPRIVFNYN